MKKFDVAMAGGGVVGAAIALDLSREGLRVGLFDRQQPGQEASWASAGILSPAPENPASVAMVPLGKASLALYPEFVARVEEISGMSAGFRRKGTLEALFLHDTKAELSTIIALHHGLGLKAEPLRAEDARELEPALSEDLEAAVLRPDECSVDNRALTLQNERVEAKWTIIAAGSFSAAIEGVAAYAPVRPAKGQMVALRAEDVEILRVLWSEHIYLVARNDGRILAGATVEYVGFDKRTTAGGVEKILSAAIELAPCLANARIEETWAGLRPDSPDHLPILGPADLEGLLMATGHFRSGILLTPITARLLREWITEQKVSVDWDRFSPLRFQSAAADAARHAPA